MIPLLAPTGEILGVTFLLLLLSPTEIHAAPGIRWVVNSNISTTVSASAPSSDMLNDFLGNTAPLPVIMTSSCLQQDVEPYEICYSVFGPARSETMEHSLEHSLDIWFPSNGDVLNVNGGRLVDDVHSNLEHFDVLLSNFDSFDRVNTVPTLLSLDGFMKVPVVLGPTPRNCAKLCISIAGEAGECVELGEGGEVVVMVFDLALYLGTRMLHVACHSEQGHVHEQTSIFEVQANLLSNKAAALDSRQELPRRGLLNRFPGPQSQSPKPHVALVTSLQTGGAELAASEECEVLKQLGYTVTIITFIANGVQNEMLLDRFKRCATEILHSGPVPDDEDDLFEIRVAESWQLVRKETRDRLEGVRSVVEGMGFDIVTVPFTKTPATETFQHVLRLVSSDTKFVLQLLNTLRAREILFISPPDGLVFPSHFVADHKRVKEFVEGWDVPKVILPPIALEPIERTWEDLRSEAVFRVGFVGRLSGERMPAAFLKVAEDVLTRGGGLGIEFYVIGGGEMLEPLKAAAESMGIAEKVTFFGEVQFHEVRKLIVDLDLDVVVNPSIETFGRGTVESMSAGALVVGCDGGGTPEIIDHEVTGWLVDCSYYIAISDKVLEAWEMKVSERVKFYGMRKLAVEKAIGAFNPSLSGPHIDSFYQSVMLGSGSIDSLILSATSTCFESPLNLEECLKLKFKEHCKLVKNTDAQMCENFIMARGCTNKESSHWSCNPTIPSSSSHWENNYFHNGTSGEGSIGIEALWKASILDEWTSKMGVKSCTELGSGDGVTLSLTKNHKHYKGYDVSRTTALNLKDKFKGDDTKEFTWYDGSRLMNEVELRKGRSHMALSMEVIFHLVEDEVYITYLKNLFNLAVEYVVIMSSNCEEDIRLKGVLESAFEGGGGGVRVRNGMCFDPSGHVRHRAFLGEVLELFGGEWTLIDFKPQKYPDICFSDFYFFRKNKNK
ncbi:hypothetical protein TrVE_jg8386 [Triparma verrucosa]|uniref:Glycosyl transferase family 1 domain-containing protein n=1 Tax=Triparma verrucosa TaxID=1606542 RepID=A0A9W7CD06_9STRA|nr:hypothetical protein TrVE_jg8386 [Triparma verrucosa]